METLGIRVMDSTTFSLSSKSNSSLQTPCGPTPPSLKSPPLPPLQTPLPQPPLPRQNHHPRRPCRPLAGAAPPSLKSLAGTTLPSDNLPHSPASTWLGNLVIVHGRSPDPPVWNSLWNLISNLVIMHRWSPDSPMWNNLRNLISNLVIVHRWSADPLVWNNLWNMIRNLVIVHCRSPDPPVYFFLWNLIDLSLWDLEL
jgi:hypothetical protein